MTNLTGPGAFEHDIARRTPSRLRDWTFSAPRNPRGRRGVFWTQIALVIAGPAILVGIVVLVYFRTAADVPIEFSGTGGATSAVFEVHEGRSGELCLSAARQPGAAGVGTARVGLIDAAGSTVRRASVLVGEAGGFQCSGVAALPDGSFRMEVVASEDVSWTAFMRLGQP